MIVSPTNSYEISLPDDILQEEDEMVSSFWRKGSNCALQLSSFKRDSGIQVSAEQRLRERKATQGGQWTDVELESMGSCGVAAAMTVDSKGLRWIHAYLVWTDLTVYATISWLQDEPEDCCDWAIEALKSVSRRRGSVGDSSRGGEH